MADHIAPNRGKIGRLQPTPPYISFLRLKAFIQTLRQRGLPDRLDLEFFAPMPTADRRQLLTALQYLHLIDAFWRPTAHFPALVDAFGTDRWPAELLSLLVRAYRPLLESDLPLATQDDLTEAFKAVFEGTDDVLRKSRTFFLHAAHEANLNLDPEVFSGIKPRSAPVRRVQPALDQPRAVPSGPPEHAALPVAKASQVVLQLWDPRRMMPEEEEAVQILLRYCKRNDL